MFKKENTLLGLGEIQIDDTTIGYTRGGSEFTVKRTTHPIRADGDRGTHVDSVLIDQEVATLKTNFIELIPENIAKIVPAMASSTATGTTTLAPTFKILTSDYHKVTWIGKTKGGTAVKIILNKAINLADIKWTMKEKDEVVQSAEFEACYNEETDLSTYAAPYSITYGTAA